MSINDAHGDIRTFKTPACDPAPKITGTVIVILPSDAAILLVSSSSAYKTILFMCISGIGTGVARVVNLCERQKVVLCCFDETEQNNLFQLSWSYWPPHWKSPSCATVHVHVYVYTHA